MSPLNKRLRKSIELLKPPPKQTVSEWAVANRILSSEASDGYIARLTLSIFCSLKRTSSALLYIVLQLRQNLESLYTDRNVLDDLQRGQIINLGLFNVINIVNPLMVIQPTGLHPFFILF